MVNRKKKKEQEVAGGVNGQDSLRLGGEKLKECSR